MFDNGSPSVPHAPQFNTSVQHKRAPKISQFNTENASAQLTPKFNTKNPSLQHTPQFETKILVLN